jgi:class 3 adenylate cyclase
VTTGDGVLAECASVVDAPRTLSGCSAEWSSAKSVMADEHSEFLIGINLSGVIVDGGDIFGD